MSWRKLQVSLSELSLDTTLRCGQSFRWRKSPDNVWSCAVHGRILSLKQDETHLHYRATFPRPTQKTPPTPPGSKNAICAGDDELKPVIDDTEALIYHYLNLEPNLTDLYEQWSIADVNFKKKAPQFTGIRILRQDAWEALLGFICSSNNNIARISQMMENLCIHYGTYIGTLDTKSFYDIPTPDSLCNASVEGHLRQLGFGYRARYIYETALLIQANERSLPSSSSVTATYGSRWLNTLRNPAHPPFPRPPSLHDSPPPRTKCMTTPPTSPTAPYQHTTPVPTYQTSHETLLSLQGVGPKVADCVCLMGLAWGSAVPVDTHVWQIAQRDYKFRGSGRGNTSLTKALYVAVGDKFRSLWGEEAGWAHSVLFTADLKAFSKGPAASEPPLEQGTKRKRSRPAKHEPDSTDDEQSWSPKEVKIKAHESAASLLRASRVAARREKRFAWPAGVAVSVGHTLDAGEIKRESVAQKGIKLETSD